MNEATVALAHPTIRSAPRRADTWKALLRAELIVQWYQRRTLVMTLLVPISFLYAWKDLIPTIGAHAVLAICLSVGLPAVGLMGYPMTVARDREKGVFQRLRATPTTTAAIMGSRILIQLATTVVLTLCTCIFAKAIDHITLAPGALVLLALAALVGGMAFLALGQAIVALVKSAEAVSAIGRLIYLPLAVVGGLAEAGVLGQTVKQVVAWSPIGTTRQLLLAAMNPAGMNMHTAAVLAATLGYGAIFATIGIRWFKWTIN
jgi:ABC-2 type transport system permease protein